MNVMLFGAERQSTSQATRSGGLSAALSMWWPIPIRLIMGYGFAAHGFAKLARGPDHFAGILSAMGVPEPHFMSLVVIFFEIFGGLSLLLGALVPLFALPMIVILLFAALTVHLPYGFSSVKLLAVTPAGAQFGQPGYEADLLYVAGILSLVIGGSGPYAVDNRLISWIARRRVRVAGEEAGPAGARTRT
ncbi:DoxX family protein [Chelatococcus sambhunathii]|nr:DoxX family protein [Chelatococcus sambhunathii]